MDGLTEIFEASHAGSATDTVVVAATDQYCDRAACEDGFCFPVMWVDDKVAVSMRTPAPPACGLADVGKTVVLRRRTIEGDSESADSCRNVVSFVGDGLGCGEDVDRVDDDDHGGAPFGDGSDEEGDGSGSSSGSGLEDGEETGGYFG